MQWNLLYVFYSSLCLIQSLFFHHFWLSSFFFLVPMLFFFVFWITFNFNLFWWVFQNLRPAVIRSYSEFSIKVSLLGGLGDHIGRQKLNLCWICARKENTCHTLSDSVIMHYYSALTVVDYFPSICDVILFS